MSTPSRVLILPGRGNSGPDHWQSHWEARHPSYRRVLQKEWDSPTLDDWLAALDAAIRADSRPTLLVAHSLSVSLVAHWAARRGASGASGGEADGEADDKTAAGHHPVVGALLVAPSDVEASGYPAGTSGFAPLPRTPLGFPAIVVASSDDPRVTTARASAFAEAWQARYVLAGAHGHLGSASLLGDWAFGAQLLEDLAVTAGVALPD